MSDLADFLLARIAEDEDVARGGEYDRPHAGHCELVWVRDDYDPDCTCDMWRRVLAECEAKRRIVGES